MRLETNKKVMELIFCVEYRSSDRVTHFSDIGYGVIHFVANQVALHVLHHVLENET